MVHPEVGISNQESDQRIGACRALNVYRVSANGESDKQIGQANCESAQKVAQRPKHTNPGSENTQQQSKHSMWKNVLSSKFASKLYIRRWVAPPNREPYRQTLAIFWNKNLPFLDQSPCRILFYFTPELSDLRDSVNCRAWFWEIQPFFKILMYCFFADL